MLHIRIVAGLLLALASSVLAADGPEAAEWKKAWSEDYQRGSYKLPVFSPDGKWLAVAKANSTVQIHDVATGKVLANLSANIGGVGFKTENGGQGGFQSPAIRSLSISGDSKTLVSVTGSGYVEVWDVAARKMKQRYTAQFGTVKERWLTVPTSAALSPDGKLLAFGGSPSFLRIQDLASGKVLANLQPQEKSISVDWLTFNPTGEHIIARVSRDVNKGLFNGAREVLIIDVSKKTVAAKLPAEDAQLVRLSPDGKSLLVVREKMHGAPKQVEVWDTAAICKGEVEKPRRTVDFDRLISPQAILNDTVIACGNFKGEIYLHDLATGKQSANLAPVKAPAESLTQWEAAFSPDGTKLAGGVSFLNNSMVIPGRIVLLARPGSVGDGQIEPATPRK